MEEPLGVQEPNSASADSKTPKSAEMQYRSEWWDESGWVQSQKPEFVDTRVTQKASHAWNPGAFYSYWLMLVRPMIRAERPLE